MLGLLNYFFPFLLLNFFPCPLFFLRAHSRLKTIIMLRTYLERLHLVELERLHGELVVHFDERVLALLLNAFAFCVLLQHIPTRQIACPPSLVNLS